MSITDRESIAESCGMAVLSHQVFTLMPGPKQITKNATDHGLDVRDDPGVVNG